MRVQDHCLTLDIVHLQLKIKTCFSSESTGPIKAKLHVKYPEEGGIRVYLNGLGHMTKMADMQYMVKPL